MPRLSAAIATFNGAERLPQLLGQLTALADEVVVLVDARTTDDSVEIARGYTDKVIRFDHDDQFFNMYKVGLANVEGDWVLHMADDETLSPEWTRAAVNELMAAKDVSHYLTPIRWLVPPGDRYLRNGPWHPFFAPRLFRNTGSIAFVGGRLHDNFHFLGERCALANMYIYHWDLAIRTRAEREAKVLRYRQVDNEYPCAEYYLYEDWYHEIEALPSDRPTLRRPAAHTLMPSTSPFCVDIRIVEAPERMVAGELYAATVEVTNRSSRPLRASSIGAYESPLYIASHWLDPESGETLELGSRQAPLPGTLPILGTRRFLLAIKAPSAPGRHALQFDLVEQNVAWFADRDGTGLRETSDLEVSLAPEAGSNGAVVASQVGDAAPLPTTPTPARARRKSSGGSRAPRGRK